MLTDYRPKARNTLHSVRCGRNDRPLVVLVHPIGLDLSYWGSQIEVLQERFDVLAYDLPGHGHSGAFDNFDYGLEALAGQLHEVIVRSGRGAAHVVGHSVGGMIAQTLAIAHPGVVSSLTLIDTACTLSPEVRNVIRQRAETTRQGGMDAILQPTLERWFTPPFALRRPDVLDRVSKTLLACAPDVHALVWEGIARLDVQPRLGTVRCPSLVMVGELDPTTPVAAARLIADSLPGATLHVIPATSHLPTLESPDEVNARMLAFLGTL